MSLSVPQEGAVAEARGDIFWDLPPWLTYAPGYDLGCHLYVANPSPDDAEYALMAELASGATVISEEALPVFGHTKFSVAGGDFIELDGALNFAASNAVLTVKLMDPASGEVIDSVATMLVAPGASASALPPPWPGSGSASAGSADWSSLLGLMMPLLMLTMLAAAMSPSSGRRPEQIKPAGSTK